nr:angiopoietin-like protein 8 [Nerophis lumbriciformis]
MDVKQKLKLEKVCRRVQTNRIIWGLCLICSAGELGAVRAGPIKRPDGVAPQEEVNVLKFGVIQLGESLNDVYQRTEGKVANILQTLKEHEDALGQLSEQTQQAAEVEKQIKGVIQLLQDLTFKQEAETKMTEGQLAYMEREEAVLQTKVKSIEAHLNGTFPTCIKELQARVAFNASILKGLQHLTQFQKQKIDKHAEQLSTLQRMSEAL